MGPRPYVICRNAAGNLRARGDVRFQNFPWKFATADDRVARRRGNSQTTIYARRARRPRKALSRMPFERLPRRMLSAWVPSRRPAGAPKMTYGRTLRKQLNKCNIEPDSWHELAADRTAWRETLKNGFAPRRHSDLGRPRHHRCRSRARSLRAAAHVPLSQLSMRRSARRRTAAAR